MLAATIAPPDFSAMLRRNVDDTTEMVLLVTMAPPTSDAVSSSKRELVMVKGPNV